VALKRVVGRRPVVLAHARELPRTRRLPPWAQLRRRDTTVDVGAAAAPVGPVQGKPVREWTFCRVHHESSHQDGGRVGSTSLHPRSASVAAAVHALLVAAPIDGGRVEERTREPTLLGRRAVADAAARRDRPSGRRLGESDLEGPYLAMRGSPRRA